jgi:two-component system sensor kinase
MTSRAGSQGFWVLWGQGTNDVARQPYSLLQGVVDGFLGRAESDPEFVETVRRRLGDHAPAVGAALPGLANVFGPAEVYASAPEEAGEVRTLHALASFLDALGTADRPVFLVLDDCQWADELTYRLIRRWQAHSGGPAALHHVLLLAALRSEEFDQNHPLRQFRSSVHLRLSPFEPSEIRRLVESMAGPLPGEVSEAIIRLADGSPFMASAVLRGLVESGSLARDSAGWRMDSQEIYEVQSSSQAAAFLSRRLALLPEDTLRLLSNGAVLGREFELNIAAELTGQSPAQSIAALDVARQRRLVWMRPDGSHCVFVHDKIRSTLLESQAGSERRRLHAQAAKFLEQHAPTRAAEIAYHFDAAGDSRSALSYALQAAEQARAQHALEIAERQYLIAERGAAEAGSAVRYRVLQELGQVLLLRGRYDAAGQKFQSAAVLVEGTFAQAQIRGKLGELAFKRGDMEHSIECVEEALRILGRRIPHSGVMVPLLLVWEAVVQAMHTWLAGLLVHRYRRQPDERERLTLQLFSNLAHSYWYCRSPLHTLWAHLRNLNLAERYTPTPELGLAYAAHAPAAACPDNDNVPYSAGCIVFLGSSYLSGMNWQANAAENVPPTRPARISR